ncbi:Glutamate--tRNA ligase, cytoplasmic [Hondaea fermentalgiana]|uniref:Glutamate--tRNA ligase, cytoplasmic n=1 Tax=Hondaea fermentalgiana TaxID=2315210 RepID=A0A2R5GRB7_9STRA|nr:Glutamate--tRNA ligase, cytoplasmic [Hondaea fermentalgiana]|eukprot:GBG33390.1 Glutamate--tRNA ligase, cytoplasmic [Hondaea fermentalgiana]
MERVAELSGVAADKGEEVRRRKDAGEPIEEALAALKAAKADLEAAVKEVLPAKEKELEDLRAKGAGEKEVADAEQVVKDLQAKLPEDKKAKKKREKEEKKKREAAAAAAAASKGGEAKPAAGKAGKEGAPAGEKGLSKKELNKLRRKEARKAGDAGAKTDAGASAAAPGATAASSSPAADGAAATGTPGAEFPMLALMVSGITKQKGVQGSTAEFGLGDGVKIRGDETVARYLARAFPDCGLYEGSASALAAIDQWVEAARVRPLASPAALDALNEHLSMRTFMATASVSLADLAVWAALARSTGGDAAEAQKLPSKNRPHLQRWMDALLSLGEVNMAANMLKKYLAAGGAQGAAASKAAKNAKNAKPAEGEAKTHTKKKLKLPPLKNAVEGKVVTRFPPEPSGHLHVGHFKAIFMNKMYADLYKGKMLLRFDDTNPNNEKVEFEEGIIEDVKALGVMPASHSYTSDHFEFILKCAVRLIKQGDAFMDDTPQETMSEERRAGVESKHRNDSIEDNLLRFMGLVFGETARAKAAKYDAADVFEDEALLAKFDKELPTYPKWCLRAKIDMASKNKALCDPVIYRGNALPHARTKNTYKAYPTYDLACPIVDSIEGVTHALRDIQYRDRVPLYGWFFPKLGLRKVEIQDFSRLNFMYTLMSKRKLKWFVEEGIVSSWNDPRFPTVKGVLRRGMTVSALQDFNVEQGVSKNATTMEYDKFWALNKKHIDPEAPRFMAVSGETNATLHVSNPDGSPAGLEWATAPNHPKNAELGTRGVLHGPEVLVELEDLQATENVPKLTVGETIILFTWGVMKVTKVNEDANGVVTSAEVTFDPDGDKKKPKRKLHWVAKSPHTVPLTMHEFDHLITKPKLEEGEDFKKYINDNSHATTSLIGEAAIRNVKVDTFLELMRRGLFRVDVAMNPNHPIDLFAIPDGRQKAMSTLGSKLTHR